MWAVFFAVVGTLLILDLFVFNKKDHVIGVKESLKFSAGYISIGLLFGLFVWASLGIESAQLYWTGFIVEQTLSMDNLFAISMILSYFAIPREYQHRVLFWGIMGVIVLRGIMIGVGATVVSQFHWVLYIFGVFLVITGIKMLMPHKETKPDISKNPMIRFFKKYLPVTDKLHGHDFFTKVRGKYYLTPLMLALVVVEFVDLIFAVDSVPAILALTTDTYIVYTCNIFAIIGLRSLYFALDAVLHRFKYLKYSLAIVLIFIGSKIFIKDLLGLEKFPPALSLGVTIALLAGGIIYSLYKTRHHKHAT